MIKLLLVLFAVIVGVLLAADVAIHSDQLRWFFAAFAAYAAASLPIPDVGIPTRNKE